MTEVLLVRTPDGFRPNSLQDAEIIKRWKLGELAIIDLKKPRNPKFHRKFFALLDIAFDQWELPIEEYKGRPVIKNRERFRKDLIIKAGFYTLNVNAITGELRMDAESISFASMDDTRFEQVYSKVIDVVLQHILTNYDREELDRVVAEILRFAA